MNRSNRYAAWILAVSAMVTLSGPATPEPISLSDTPLFLNVAVDPNIVVTMDDSGSMRWAVVPDALIDYGLSATKRIFSSSFNALYYNPNVRYVPPKNASNVDMANSSFSAAWINGLDTAKGTVDLTKNYRPPFYYDPKISGTYEGRTGGYATTLSNPSGVGTEYNFTSNTTIPVHITYQGGSFVYKTNGVAAFYFVFDSGNSACDGTLNDDDCYDYVKVASNSGPGTIDINGDGAITTADRNEQQNFANWYSYYSNRVLATASGALLAFNAFPENVRLAWQALGDCKSFGGTCKDKKGTLYDNKIRQFSGTHRSNFLNWLINYPAAYGTTPLRDAMYYAGSYYETSGIASPYAENPQVTAGTELSCRKNYHIMFTDGVWNGDVNMTGANKPGNADNTAVSLPDGMSYSPTLDSSIIFKDGNTDSLADLAFKYWVSDLRTDINNDVVPRYVDRSGTETDQYWNPRNNPANWQNMTTYTVSLGLSSTLTNPVWEETTSGTGYTDLKTGVASWPTTGDYLAGNVYDLWHSAINSRAEFFSVESPDALVSSLQAVVNSILDATPSAAALAANSTSIQTGALVYQARFDSKDWSGDLLAYPVQSDGSVGSAIWQAKNLMPSPGSRNIFTIDGAGDGVAFTACSNLTTSQQTALNTNASGSVDSRCTDRLNWLRGNSVSGMRSRTSILADIINSDPVYTHSEDMGYGSASFTGGGTAYTDYVEDKAANRIPMVYVGSNGGMLHGFRADVGASDSGIEKFAYIPNTVFANLSQLTDPDYVHKYFVDAGPTVGDAYLGGVWKTILVSGMGGGGKAVFALDVSNPGTPSTSLVKWEFADADLGYSFSKPQIGRLPDGSWVAIFGNGYNSASEQAYLYIVNLDTGALIKKIAAGTATSNGLSTPTLYDSNGDKTIDTVYAGDLQGNLWKFDLLATNSADWALANSGVPLFQARNDLGQVQPITAAPVVGGHTLGGAMVLFGTGRYLGNTDVLDSNVQSFYGLWDNGSPISTTDRSELQEQTLVAETIEFGSQVRESSTTVTVYPSSRGWYMDFNLASGVGERVVTQALLRYERVIFLTLVPSTEACDPGGFSWLMELEMESGAAPAESSFDFNNDGKFDSDDLLASGESAAGIRTTVGITKPPAWFSSPPPSDGGHATDFKVMTGTTGGIQSLGNKGDEADPDEPGGGGGATRLYWRQIQ